MATTAFVSLKGTPEYRAAVLDLLDLVAADVPEVESLSDLLAHALETVAERYGRTMPPRSHPRGTNRWTTPQ